MKVLFDGGTSRLHRGLWVDGCLVEIDHVPYPEKSDDFSGLIADMLAGTDASSAVACSVSHIWREPLFETLATMFPGQLAVARTAADLSLTIPYTHPETYGIDRALAVSAAWRRYGDSCVVADAGTALTVDAMDEHGAVAGGYIIPGCGLQVASLRQVTGLPNVIIEDPGAVLGTDTESAIGLGIAYGFLAAAEQLIRLAEGAVNANGRIVLTGGDASRLVAVLPETVAVVPGLVLEGLGYAADRLPRFS